MEISGKKSFGSQPTEVEENDPREILKAELLKLAIDSKEGYIVPATILQSDAYCKLQERAEKRKVMQESDQIWEEIETVVKACSPDFRRKLNLLTKGRLTAIDYRTALLLKCGIKPSLMAILAGRSQGSIVSRRESLGRKILDEKTGLAIVDRMIQYI